MSAFSAGVGRFAARSHPKTPGKSTDGELVVHGGDGCEVEDSLGWEKDLVLVCIVAHKGLVIAKVQAAI
jgi:hypothetical protein